MGAVLDAWYLWIKALHVISVIAWMAGLLYLPRLFVYHSEVEPGSPQSETFKVMERRLLRAIMNPAMILAFVFGGLMLAAQLYRRCKLESSDCRGEEYASRMLLRRFGIFRQWS